MVKKFIAMATLECSGDCEHHRLAVTKHGAVVALDHPDEKRWKLLEEIGAELPACLQYRQKMVAMMARQPYFQQGPELIDHLQKIRKKRDDRRIHKISPVTSEYDDIQAHWHEKFAEAVVRVFKRCGYTGLGLHEKPPAGWRFGGFNGTSRHQLIVADIFRGTKHGSSWFHNSWMPDQYVCGQAKTDIQLWLPSHWYRCIYKPNHAIINGHFVHTILMRSENKILYRMVGQEPSGKFYTYEMWHSHTTKLLGHNIDLPSMRVPILNWKMELDYP